MLSTQILTLALLFVLFTAFALTLNRAIRTSITSIYRTVAAKITGTVSEKQETVKTPLKGRDAEILSSEFTATSAVFGHNNIPEPRHSEEW